MTINYNVTGTERKRLAEYIAGFLGCDAKYQYAPSFAYQVGFITVSKTGSVSFDDRAASHDTEVLMAELEAEGFHAEPVKLETMADQVASEPTEAAIQGATAELDQTTGGEKCALSVEMSFGSVNMGNLTKLLEAKGDLIQKALGLPSLPLEMHEETVGFPWFSDQPDPDTVNARTHFIAALCEMSRTQKRITATAKEVDNEKYAFRCFLLRLGFIGDEYKTERKILLRNLSGSSAFKSGARKSQPTDGEEVATHAVSE